MLKITLLELKKSLYAIKDNNLLECIAGEQLINIENNTTFPLVNLYDILNGTLNMLNILKNRGFINVKTIFENKYEQTESITLNPILHSKLKIPLFESKTFYNKGEIVFIYPRKNKKSKYLRGIVDKYKSNNLFIHVFDITGTIWSVKNIYNIHKDYSYQYIIKLPMSLNNKSFNSLNILKIDLSYFFKTIYTFIASSDGIDTNYTIDVNNLLYDKIVWTNNNLTINNYEYILEQINIFKVNIDNIYSTISYLALNV
jgi:hypothetical protein